MFVMLIAYVSKCNVEGVRLSLISFHFMSKPEIKLHRMAFITAVFNNRPIPVTGCR